jgi:hypothetical protein
MNRAKSIDDAELFFDRLEQYLNEVLPAWPAVKAALGIVERKSGKAGEGNGPNLIETPFLQEYIVKNIYRFLIEKESWHLNWQSDGALSLQSPEPVAGIAGEHLSVANSTTSG